MGKVFAIAAGGAIGALARYFISGLVHKSFGAVFPIGTMVVNLTGAFCVGILWGAFESVVMPANLRLFLFVGCLGAFTTFSTFCLENLNLIRDGEYYLGGLNIILSNIFGVFLVFAGLICSRFVMTVLR